jgi:hypothetical protein
LVNCSNREKHQVQIYTGFNPLAPATDAFEEHALSVFSAQLGVFATHDVYVAVFLHARGVKTDFNPDNWPRFLDSAAIVLRPDGERRYMFVRAGLSPLVCGVGGEGCGRDCCKGAET